MRHSTGRFMMRSAVLAFCLAAAGCSGYWGHRALDRPTPINPDDTESIWSGGEVMKWRVVVITQDSVSGLPPGMYLHCDTCRRSIARTRVDSMKVGYRTLPQNVIEMVVIVTAATILDGVLCYLIHAKDNQC